jgi:hypothetical protein
MWGMFVWGVGLGAVITYVFVHTFEGAGLDHWSRLLGITIFWTGFWFFMRGKYVAWRAAQQLPPPDASS